MRAVVRPNLGSNGNAIKKLTRFHLVITMAVIHLISGAMPPQKAEERSWYPALNFFIRF